MRRYYLGLDTTPLTLPELEVLRPALEALRFPTGRIVRKTGQRLPIDVADLSRFAAALDAHGHGHVHEAGQHGHLLGEPEHVAHRRAPLGLYWLPTADFPAGRVQVGAHALAEPPVAREVLIAEVAHGVDYGAITPRQRARIYRLFHDTLEHPAHGPLPDELGPDEWFEGHPGGYWSWPGERFMGLFMAAYTPTLPRPLEARQPWTHHYDERDVAALRRILRRPGP